MVTVGLSSIQTSLHAGPAQVQLIIAGYTLAVALMVVPAGRLGDMRGRRMMFIVGIASFGVMSLLAGLATNGTWLGVVRVLQGASAGAMNPQTVGIIQQLFVGKERGKAFGFMGIIVGVATAMGPVVGGVIMAVAGLENGWRWLFFVNVPAVLVVVWLARRLLPPPALDRKAERLDVPGIGLVGLAAVCVMAPFVLSNGVDVGSWRWGLIGVAALVIVGFVAWERQYQERHGAAVMDPALLGNVGFRFGVLIGAAYFTGFTSVSLVVTIVLQLGLGYSPLSAGFVIALFAVGSGSASAVTGRMVGRYGRMWVVFGLSLMLVGLTATNAVLRWAPAESLTWALSVTMLVAGLGSGAVISPNQTLTLASVPPRIGGVAGGVLQVGQQVGSSIGLSVVLSAFYGQLVAMGARGSAARALLVSMAVITAALVVAIVDWRRRRGFSEVLV